MQTETYISCYNVYYLLLQNMRKNEGVKDEGVKDEGMKDEGVKDEGVKGVNLSATPMWDIYITL